VLVTHDVSEAVHLAERVIVLEEDRISKDMAVPHPHLRKRDSAELSELEGRLSAAISGS